MLERHPGAEDVRRQIDVGDLEPVDELRPDAGRLHPADDLAVLDAGLLEGEDVLHDDDLAFHFLDLGHVDDLSGAVLHTVLLDDEVDRGGDLLADGEDRQVHAGHQAHRLDTRKRIAGAIGVGRGHRSIVTGVHCLHHVERLAAATLPDDDPLGAHPTGVDDEVTDGDLALAFDVGRTRIQTDDVLLTELRLGRVLDRDDSLVVWDEGREDVEHRRLAGTGAVGDDSSMRRPSGEAMRSITRITWSSSWKTTSVSSSLPWRST